MIICFQKTQKRYKEFLIGKEINFLEFIESEYDAETQTKEKQELGKFKIYLEQLKNVGTIHYNSQLGTEVIGSDRLQTLQPKVEKICQFINGDQPESKTVNALKDPIEMSLVLDGRKGKEEPRDLLETEKETETMQLLTYFIQFSDLNDQEIIALILILFPHISSGMKA